MKKKWIILVVFSVVGLFIDIGTKYIAEKELKPTIAVPVFGEVFELYLTHNTGIVFGLNPRKIHPAFPVNLFFYVFSVVAITVLLVYFHQLTDKQRITIMGLSLILPGALGNCIDRVLHPQKGVVDFLKVDFGFWPFNPWPIFNMADVFLTCGIVLILIDMLFVNTTTNPAMPDEQPS